VWGRREVYTGFWWGNLREKGYLEEPDVVGRLIFIWVFGKWDLIAWTGSSWFRIGTGGGHL
jgi:hypothetical protein